MGLFNNCSLLTLSVEFTLSVRLAINGPNMLTSFYGGRKTLVNFSKDVLLLLFFQIKTFKILYTCEVFENVKKAGSSKTSLIRLLT